MTLEEFVFKWKHEWRGMLMDDSWKSMPPGQKSIYFRGLEAKIEAHLRQMFAEAQGKPANNGTVKKT